MTLLPENILKLTRLWKKFGNDFIGRLASKISRISVSLAGCVFPGKVSLRTFPKSIANLQRRDAFREGTDGEIGRAHV